VTLKAFAKSLGVSPATLQHIIRTRGAHYKSAPPDERAETLRAHRSHCQALREANLL
jgi:hypothetical protein